VIEIDSFQSDFSEECKIPKIFIHDNVMGSKIHKAINDDKKVS
jgi:hypothetical protein